MGKTFFGALLALLLVTTASNATPFSVVTTLPSDPSAAANWYSGSALATSGTVIAVGAPGGDTSDGATTGTGKGYVSLFNCPPAGSATTCVYASDVTGPASGSLFGASIVLLNNGTFLAVGAPGYSSSAGYVQFYSLATVTSPASITSFAPNYASAQLGFAMAGTMSGSTLWVFAGAPYYEETSGAGDCTFSSPCGTVAMYVCTVSGTTYSCPAQTSYAFNDAYNTGYAVAAAVVSSGVVGLATVDPGGKYIMYTFRCTATACGSATTPSPTASYSFGNINCLAATPSFLAASGTSTTDSSSRTMVYLFPWSCSSSTCTLGSLTTSFALNNAVLSASLSSSTLLNIGTPGTNYLYSCGSTCSVLATVTGSTTTGYAPPIVNDQYSFFGVSDAHASSDQGAVYLSSCNNGAFPNCPAPYSAFPFSRTIPASGTGAASDSYQGYAVASSGNVLAVGAPQCQITVSGTITGQNGNGFVSMYSCTAGNVCSAPSTISGSSYSNGCFGWSVGLTSSGQLLAIGAPGYSSSKGVVVVYSCPAYNSCATVTTSPTVTPSASASVLGYSLTVSTVSGAVWVMSGAPNQASQYGYLYSGYCTTTKCVWGSSEYPSSSQYYAGQAIASAPGYSYSMSASAKSGSTNAKLYPMSSTYASSTVTVSNLATYTSPYTSATLTSLAMTTSFLVLGIYQSGVGLVDLYACNFANANACPIASAFTLTDPSAAVSFGYSVSASNNALAVADLGGAAVYLYQCSAYNTCSLSYTINADPAFSGDNFGSGLDLNDDLYNFVVGGSAYNNNTGQPYVYACSSDASFGYAQNILQCATPTATATAMEILTLPATFTASATKSSTKSMTASATKSSTNSMTESATKSATNSLTKSATYSATYSLTRSSTMSFTQSATLSYTKSASESATNSATHSVTGSATYSATNSATVSSTNSASNSATASTTDSATYSVTGSATASATHSATASSTNSATASPTNSATASLTNSATASPTNSATASLTNSATASPTNSATASLTNSATALLTNSATASRTNSATAAATDTATVSSTDSATVSSTDSATDSSTDSATATFTQSATASATPLGTQSATPSSSPSAAASFTQSVAMSSTTIAEPTSVYATATPSASATQTATATASDFGTTTASVSATASATGSAIASATASATGSITESATATGSITESATESATYAATYSATASGSASSAATATASGSASSAATATASGSDSTTATATASGSDSTTATATASGSASSAATATASGSDSTTATATESTSATDSASASPSATATASLSATASAVPSTTASFTQSAVPSATATATQSVVPSATASSTHSATPSAVKSATAHSAVSSATASASGSSNTRSASASATSTKSASASSTESIAATYSATESGSASATSTESSTVSATLAESTATATVSPTPSLLSAATESAKSSPTPSPSTAPTSSHSTTPPSPTTGSERSPSPSPIVVATTAGNSSQAMVIALSVVGALLALALILLAVYICVVKRRKDREVDDRLQRAIDAEENYLSKEKAPPSRSATGGNFIFRGTANARGLDVEKRVMELKTLGDRNRVYIY